MCESGACMFLSVPPTDKGIFVKRHCVVRSTRKIPLSVASHDIVDTICLGFFILCVRHPCSMWDLTTNLKAINVAVFGPSVDLGQVNCESMIRHDQCDVSSMFSTMSCMTDRKQKQLKVMMTVEFTFLGHAVPITFQAQFFCAQGGYGMCSWTFFWQSDWNSRHIHNC